MTGVRTGRAIMAGGPPDTRVQRTRSSASPPRSRLTRHRLSLRSARDLFVDDSGATTAWSRAPGLAVPLGRGR